MEELRATATAHSLLDRVVSLMRAGRPAAARPLLAAARRLLPPSPELGEIAARLALVEGCPEKAMAELDAAVVDAPEHAGLRKLRADVRSRLNDRQGALADAAEAVVLAPHDAAAKALLGILLLEIGRSGDALACLQEAVATDARNPNYRQGLAAALEAEGDRDAALQALTAGIAAMPGAVDLRNAAILLSIRRRDFTTALQLAEDARVTGVVDPCLFGLKGHVLSSLGRHAEAGDAYTEALKLGPEDPYVRHLVAASGTLPGRTRAPVEYVRTVFDGYADRFELHLVSLGYRMPGLIRAALLQHPTVQAGGRLGPALDLGCGTGLVALALSDLPVAPLVGVDVSRRMLAHAAAKQLYAELLEGDLLETLADTGKRWRLILAADVLVYFGALEEVFAATFAALEPGGWLVLAVEELLPDHAGTLHGGGCWALQRQGRYAHAMDYVASTAANAGFVLRSLERQTLRFEADAPVTGILAVLERPHDA